MDDLIEMLEFKIEHQELLMQAVSIGLAKTIGKQEWQIKELTKEIELLKKVIDDNIRVGGTDSD